MFTVRVDVYEGGMTVKDGRGAVLYSGPVTDHVAKIHPHGSANWLAERDGRGILTLVSIQ